MKGMKWLGNITFEFLPTSMDEFLLMPQAKLQNPEDTAALTIVAYTIYPSNKELAIQMLNYLQGPRPLTGFDKRFVANRLRNADYVPRSYFFGASPKNDYTPNHPYVLTFSENKFSRIEHGFVRLWAKSSGSAEPRSISLRFAKDKKWYLWECGSILLGINKPESANPWA